MITFANKNIRDIRDILNLKMEAVWYFETSVTINHLAPRKLVYPTVLSEPQISHLLIGTRPVQNGLQKEMLYRQCF